MADVNRGNRPLSPHLTIYRPQWTSLSSILVRITGNALIVAAVMLAVWFLAAAVGPEAFAKVDWFVNSLFGNLIMVGSLWALVYHSLGGIRHLIWDSGYMLDVRRSELFAKISLLASTVLTAALVLLFALWG